MLSKLKLFPISDKNIQILLKFLKKYPIQSHNQTRKLVSKSCSCKSFFVEGLNYKLSQGRRGNIKGV